MHCTPVSEISKFKFFRKYTLLLGYGIHILGLGFIFKQSFQKDTAVFKSVMPYWCIYFKFAYLTFNVTLCKREGVLAVVDLDHLSCLIDNLQLLDLSKIYKFSFKVVLFSLSQSLTLKSVYTPPTTKNFWTSSRQPRCQEGEIRHGSSF